MDYAIGMTIGMSVTMAAFVAMMFFINKKGGKPDRMPPELLHEWKIAHELTRQKIEVLERIAARLTPPTPGDK